MNISRRALFGASAAGALALAGCASMSAEQVTQQAVTDIGLIAQGAAAILPSISAIAGLPQETVATVTAYATEISGLAGKVTTTLAQSAAQPLVQQIEADVSGVANALTGVSLPPAATKVLQAIQVLMPVIQVAVGLLTAGAAANDNMTPDQARAVLRAA